MSSERLESIFRIVSSPKAARAAALLATVAVAKENATEGADLFFDSGPITSNNVVGWDPAPQLTYFDMQASGDRLFRFARAIYTNIKYLYVIPHQLNASTFAVATDIAARGGLDLGLEFFDFGDKWTTAVDGEHNLGGMAGILRSAGAEGEVSPEENVYFLFKFEDAGTPYYGWIDVDILVEGNSATGSNYVRINRYAWQSSTLGVLEAGITPVPEPSSLVMAGLTALTGGAIALRRMRKERASAAKSA